MNLYAHQQKIIDEDPKKCGLFMGTGSGKTRTALLLARGHTLIIAPKTQVEDGNWEREYEILVREQPGYNGPDYKTSFDITVISKETFRRDHATLPRFDTVIVDEAHTCLGVTPNTRQRNRVTIPKASQLFEALDEFLNRTNPNRIYLCTATIMKSPMTVWAAKKILYGPAVTVDSFYYWRHTFYTKLPMPGREVWVAKRDSETKEKLAEEVKALGYIGRLDDFFDVPEQTFITKHIELTAAQKARIKELRTEFPDPIVQIGKRHQVENGFLYGDEFNEPESFDNGKIEKILELAEEFPRMVIFAKYTAQIVQICNALERAGKSWGILDGGVQDRGAQIAQANFQKEFVFVCQAQISAGWELPDYPVMVFASRTYSWVDYEQAKGRILRANRLKKNLYINLVVKGGIDEAVDKSLANKQSFDERLYLGI